MSSHSTALAGASAFEDESALMAAIAAELDAPKESDWPQALRCLASFATASAPVALSVYDDLAAIEQDWREFEQQAHCTVFQTFDWLSTWHAHIGARNDVRPAIVVGRGAGGDILFILPLATQPHGLARELTWLGSALCDYNAPLLAPGFSAHLDDEHFKEIWSAALRRIRIEPGLEFDLVRLLKMPATVGAQANPLLALGVMADSSGAYATALGERWEEFYVAKRSGATRGRERTKRRRLAEFGEVRMVSCDAASDALETLDVLMGQKAQSFARMGVSNLFTRPGHADFYRALATGPRTRHFVHVSRLDVGSQIAAVNIGLTFRDTYYHLQASHVDGEIARFGPGTAHLHELMRYAIDRGFKVYDFTIGDESYKRDWCDGTQTLYGHIAAVTWRGALVGAGANAMQRLKRHIKQTPRLWRAFSKARALIGSFKSPARTTEDAQ